MQLEDRLDFDIGPETGNAGTKVIYLEVPGSHVVFLQAIFETYEGVGVVRTLDIRKSLVCILSTPDMLEACWQVLESIRAQVQWRVVGRPSPAEEERYLGYFRRAHAQDNT